VPVGIIGLTVVKILCYLLYRLGLIKIFFALQLNFFFNYMILEILKYLKFLYDYRHYDTDISVFTL